MTTAICFSDATFYTDAPVGEVVKALADGQPIACWWYASCGARCAETFIFFADPLWVRTESETA